MRARRSSGRTLPRAVELKPRAESFARRNFFDKKVPRAENNISARVSRLSDRRAFLFGIRFGY
jgi:hypothetical protein